jgi:hypothetical protein
MTDRGGPRDLLGHLVHLTLDDDPILADLRRLHDRFETLRDDLASPAALGLVLLGIFRKKYREGLGRLRANRAEVRRLLDAAGLRE